MPIVFASLVLAPAMTTFAIPIMVYPFADAGVVGYPARGIFNSVPIDVVMQDGAIFSDQRTTLGISAADYVVPIVKLDRIEIGDTKYWVSDVASDGQGGLLIDLRKTAPPEALAP